MPAFYNRLIQLPQDREKPTLYPIGLIGEYKHDSCNSLCYGCYNKFGLYEVYFKSLYFDQWIIATALSFDEAKALFEALKWLNLTNEDIPYRLTKLIKQSRLKKNQDIATKKDGLFWFFIDGLTSQIGLLK